MALALAASLAWGCGAEADPLDLDGGAPPPSTVTFHLAWDLTGVTVEDDGAWSVVTDRDLTVRIERAWLVFYQASLVPCASVEPQGSLGDDLLWLLGVGVAHAGHDDPGMDPSTWPTPTVEWLVPPAPRTFGPRAVPDQTYCRAHYLVGRSDEGTAELPDAVDLDRLTLWFEGTWQAPGGAPTPFVLRTALANGRLSGLYPPGAFGDADAARRVEVGPAAVEITFRRALGTVFDGVDFAVGGEDAWARVVLTNLVDDLVVELR